MGVSSNAIKSLFVAKKNAARFDAVVTLGRQHLFSNSEEIQAIAASFGEEAAVKEIRLTDLYAEPFFKALGATTVDSMDFSDYESANIIHDLNKPVPEQLYEKYDLVFDGGTLEHVFNFPQAIKNAMQMVKNGGHFISVTPANNQLGHGFYQFSPELYFRIFSKENGFEVVKIFVSVYSQKRKWFEVKDPNAVRSRVTLMNAYETDMIVIAKRVAVTEIFENTPQQSDYVATWETKSEEDAVQTKNAGTVKNIYQKIIPAKLRGTIWKLRYQLTHKQRYSDELGRHHPHHFVETDY